MGVVRFVKISRKKGRLKGKLEGKEVCLVLELGRIEKGERTGKKADSEVKG